jgi:hypothetical protein
MDMPMVDVTEIDCTEGDRNYFGETQRVSISKTEEVNDILSERFLPVLQRSETCFYRLNISFSRDILNLLKMC